MPVKIKVLLSAAFTCQILFTTAAMPAANAGESTTGTAATQNDNWYTIQVSSSRESEDAARQVAVLKSHGLDAVSSLEEVEGKGMWYRVYVGRFDTKREAEIVAARLESEGIISGYWINVLKYPDALPVSVEPDLAEPSVIEKVESPEQKVPQVASKEPVEPRISPDDQVKVPPPQLPAESGGAVLVATSEKVESRPVEETLSPSPPAPEIKIDSAEPAEPQVNAPAPPAQLPAESGSSVPIAPPEENEGMPVKDTLIRAPATGSKVDSEISFSVGLRLGGIIFPGLDEFRISSPTTDYYFKNKYLSGAIVPSFRLNRSFSLEGSVEKIMNAEFDFLYASVGPKWRLAHSSGKGLFNLSPYIRGAVAWGDMSWDDVPGSFDSGLGGEMGIGLDVIKIRSSLKLGMEMSYRSIKFGYNVPSDRDVTSSQDKIDFSGFTLTGFMNYYF